MHNLCFCLALLVSVSFLLSGSRAQYNSYGIPLQQSRETVDTVLRQSNPGLYNPLYMGGANQGLSRGGYSNPLYLGGANQGLSSGGLSNPLYMNRGNSGLPIGGLSNPLYMGGANQGLSNYGLSNSGYGRGRFVRSPVGELPR